MKHNSTVYYRLCAIGAKLFKEGKTYDEIFKLIGIPEYDIKMAISCNLKENIIFETVYQNEKEIEFQIRNEKGQVIIQGGQIYFNSSHDNI